MPYDAQGNYVADTATPTIDPSGNLSITPTATACLLYTSPSPRD